MDCYIASCCHRHFKQDFLGIGNNGKGNDKQAALASHEQGSTPSYPIDPTWYMDTGATNHLTRVIWERYLPRSCTVAMIRFAQPTEQVCTSHILARLCFLHIYSETCISSMSFEFLLPHVVCFLFLNLFVIIMSSLNFIVFIFISRIWARGTCFLMVVYAMDYMHLMCHQSSRLSTVGVCHLPTGMRVLVILPHP
jgi:hypothetical protein